MNVMIFNKYKDLLMGLGIEVMKTLDGVYNVDEIIDAFSNFYYDKMIIDITAIRDYQNTDNLQKLAMNINMENVILLLDDSPETSSKNYVSKLISLGIYNFTKNAEGINYLLVHPHTYRDVANIHDIDDMPAENNQNSVVQNNNDNKVVEEKIVYVEREPVNNGRQRIIGFKDITNHAGATSLIYMIKKELESRKSVSALEINKVDFLYFNDKDMISTTTPDLLKEIVKRNNDNVILIDINDYEEIDVCSEIYYLVEPSTLMINKLIKKDRSIFEKLRKEKVILNKCMLSREDITTFEYETKLKIFYAMPYVDDRQENLKNIRELVDKMKL